MTGKRYFNTLQRGMTLIELSVVLMILVALAGLAAPYVGGIGSTASCQTTDATMHAVKEAIMGGTAGAGFYGDTLGEYPKATKGQTTADYTLNYLFTKPAPWDEYNAKTGVGWRGPYLQSGGVLSLEDIVNLDSSFDAYNATTNPNGKAHINHRVNTVTQVFDAWHRPIILQIPYDTSTTPPTAHPEYARLISAGPTFSGSAIDTKIQYDSTFVDGNGVHHPLPDALDRNDDRVIYLKMPDPLPGGNTPCDEN